MDEKIWMKINWWKRTRNKEINKNLSVTCVIRGWMCAFYNTKWQTGNQLTIYKHGGTFERRTDKRQIQTTVKACLDPGSSVLRIPCTHPAMPSLLASRWPTDKKSDSNFILFWKVNASSGAYPKNIPTALSKKFLQQLVRTWSFVRIPTIEKSMNSSSLLPLTFLCTFWPYTPCQSSRNKFLCSFWYILRQFRFHWLRSNMEHGRYWFEVTQWRLSRQHFHNSTTHTPLGKKETIS